MINVAGTDSTKQFEEFHRIETLNKYMPKLCIGTIGEPEEEKKMGNGKVFGELSQYIDPSWYQGFNSPYFNESHYKFREACREFTDKEMTPFCHEWEETREFPKGFHQKAYQAGLYPGMSGQWPVKYVDVPPAGGVKPEKWDYFYEYILLDETGFHIFF